MVGGKIKIERKIDIIQLSTLLIIGLTVLWNIFGYSTRIFDSAKQKSDVLDYIEEGHSLSPVEVDATRKHISSTNQHQPYKEKLKEWAKKDALDKVEKDLELLKREYDRDRAEREKILMHILREVKKR